MFQGSGFRANQPYHAAAEMQLAQAEAFLKQTEETAVGMAAAQIQAAMDELAAAGHRVTQAAVLLGSSRPLPELSKILAAHPLIHTAEGIFYRSVLRSACERCGLAVTGIRERDVPPDLSAQVATLGKILGPPWTQDEKLSAAAAIHAVAPRREEKK